MSELDPNARLRGRKLESDSSLDTAAAPVGKHSAFAKRLGAGQRPIDALAADTVANKSSGHAADTAIKGKVEAQVGASLGDVRVHTDDASRTATSAMGARAFAHGGDVFLGVGESTTDTSLMAHELTHVAQQGHAQRKAVQAQITVGDQNSPAEAEADAVADKVATDAPPTSCSSTRIAASS